jgi:transcriptional regulator with XRE-family HTH domain
MWRGRSRQPVVLGRAVDPDSRAQITRRLQLRLSRNLRTARAARGLTQEGLAGVTGMAVRHLQKVEAGEVNLTLQSLAVLATALDVDAADLLAPSSEGASTKAGPSDRRRRGGL